MRNNNIFTNADTGDYVLCTNCEEKMLVEHGQEICPVCFKDGCLQWADIEQECTVDEYLLKIK